MLRCRATRTGNRLSPRCGFTIVELVMVLLIVSIMTALTAPRFFRSLNYHQAEAAARRVKLDLERAQRRAKTQSSSQAVQLDPDSHGYLLPGLPDLDRPGTDYTVQLDRSPYRARLLSADFDGEPQVVFDGFGVPDSGGEVVVQSGQYQKAIIVEPSSGRVRIE